jgi:hypothetical protein
MPESLPVRLETGGTPFRRPITGDAAAHVLVIGPRSTIVALAMRRG